MGVRDTILHAVKNPRITSRPSTSVFTDSVNHISCILLYIFVGKNLQGRGPTRFKAVLFKAQLYSDHLVLPPQLGTNEETEAQRVKHLPGVTRFPWAAVLIYGSSLFF